MLNWPPISPAASNRSTAWPRSASVVARGEPRRAGADDRDALARARRARARARSRGTARGLTRQRRELAAGTTWSRQAWLQAMQVLISSARPGRGLAHELRVGQQRPRHATPCRRCRRRAICSATSGVLMRLVVTSGIVDLAACSSRARRPRRRRARGTEVAMVGHARLVPADAGVDDRRAGGARSPCASCTTSSQVWPSGIRSSIDRR